MPIPITAEQLQRLEEKRRFASALSPLPVILIVGSWLWLEFSEKPPVETRDTIKNNGFLFSAKHKRWFFNGSNAKGEATRLSWSAVQARNGVTVVAPATEEETRAA